MILKITKYERREKLLKWAIMKFIKLIDDKDLRITKRIIWDLDYKKAYKGFQEFKKYSNRGKTIFNIMASGEMGTFKTMVIEKKDKK